MITQSKAIADPHINPQMPSQSLYIWLLGVAAMVFIMVIVGAITRLTDSGLSMVEWRPIMGALPPMTEAEWQRVYSLYQQSPEFIKKNSWMALDDFKAIFFWEWFHRLLGRFIGLAYAVPLFIFWVKGLIPSAMRFKLLGLLILGGAQGFMGWYMVKSGLVDVPAVSHFRLAAHLGLALIIYACLISLALDIRSQRRQNTQQAQAHPYASQKALLCHGWGAITCFVATLIWGAFTAGMDAGLVYNTHFPMLAEGQWLPDSYDILHEHSAIQFTHRWLAILTMLMILSWVLHAYLKGAAFPALYALGGAIIVQAGLGVGTLLSGVHLHVAVTHQAGALVCLFLIIIAIRHLRPCSP